MELLLNLAWLLLALPAYWLWRASSNTRRFSSAQCLLALASLLVILFPVVSATDDLRAMRTEMEESQVNKRTLRQASSEKDAGAAWHSSPVLTSTTFSVLLNDFGWLPLPAARVSVTVAPSIERPSRAPPASRLA
jgi:hypothetical protein